VNEKEELSFSSKKCRTKGGVKMYVQESRRGWESCPSLCIIHPPHPPNIRSFHLPFRSRSLPAVAVAGAKRTARGSLRTKVGFLVCSRQRRIVPDPFDASLSNQFPFPHP